MSDGASAGIDQRERGFLRLEWAREHMPVMAKVRESFQRERPFRGMKVAMALHVEAKTGILALLFREGGADVRLASCNPLSTDDSVVASLKEDFGLSVYARRGETNEEYYDYLNRVLDIGPDIVVDDGGDLVRLLHTERKDIDTVIGGNEETTTGVVRLRAMEKNGVLRFPMFDVNDAMMKHFFDNRYGTGQSTLDGIMNATNLVIAGKDVVVAGYGFCGKGIAMRMRGMGASVTVTEIDPVKAVEAIMDGFRVERMSQALRHADIVVTATGMKNVVRYDDLLQAKPGLILANSGHFNNEIEVDVLVSRSMERRRVRDHVDMFRLENGNRVYLISEGRLVNLAAGQGHPAEIMDMSFAIQALTARYLAENHHRLERRVYPVPREIDMEVARLKLESMGVEIDRLDSEQERYAESWEEGT
ncbi:S-adenosyl-L-homocysteine hydrolase [Thermogymnomonas acidicola]|uniref:Adenosylhomocysteinase n=1 Tax=Thermogymnomonas acidicola TaxID=399579 RepID=A0AA37BS40_9ARCH|nr:adenosylhomocysteinase [Thermogymnomonas acidicola]GGM73686.1 S-adenosyl-L-homocysteine hydrolase [Thermogymnomonas acidicola]